MPVFHKEVQGWDSVPIHLFVNNKPRRDYALSPEGLVDEPNDGQAFERRHSRRQNMGQIIECDRYFIGPNKRQQQRDESATKLQKNVVSDYFYPNFIDKNSLVRTKMAV